MDELTEALFRLRAAVDDCDFVHAGKWNKAEDTDIQGDIETVLTVFHELSDELEALTAERDALRKQIEEAPRWWAVYDPEGNLVPESVQESEEDAVDEVTCVDDVSWEYELVEKGYTCRPVRIVPVEAEK